MMRKLLACLIGLTLSLVIGAQPAQAAVSGSINFYDNVTPTGLLVSYSAASVSPTVCHALPSSANNKTGYIINGANVSFVVFDNSTCSSTPGVIYANSSGAMNSDWTNKISSWYRNP